LGFGVYRHKGLVQIFENKNLWFDIGYQENDGGDIEDGEIVALTRTPKSSPEFLEKHSTIDDLIRFEVFDGEGGGTSIEGTSCRVQTRPLLSETS
jgi:superfamily I DNA and RNA helicase